MRKIITINVLCTLFILGTACHKSKNTISNNKSKAVKETVMSVTEKGGIDTILAKKQTVIHLDSDPSAVISKIDKILMDENKIFVLDQSSSKVLVYNKAGFFLGKLTDIGRGPQEYRGLTDISLDPKTKTIYLLTDVPYKILSYDYDLNYLDEIELDELYLEFIKQENYFICRRAETLNNQANNFYYDIVDVKTGQVLKQILPIQEEASSLLAQSKFPGSQMFMHSASSVLLTTVEEASLYEFENQALKKKYDFANLSHDDNTKMDAFIANIMESEGYVFFKTLEGLAVYNKKQDEFFLYKYGILNTKININLNSFLPIGNHTDKIAFIKKPIELKTAERSMKDYYEKNNIPKKERNTDFLEFAATVSDDDNMILFVYDIK